MAIEILRDSNVNDADQVALVDKYTKLRQSCDVKGIMEIVTDDIQLESALASPKGRGAYTTTAICNVLYPLAWVF